MTHAISQRFHCLRITHKDWKFMQFAFIRIDKTVYHWSMGHHKCMLYVVRIRYMAQRLCYSSAHSNKASNRMVMFKLLLVPLSHPVICCKTMCMQCSNTHTHANNHILHNGLSECKWSHRESLWGWREKEKNKRSIPLKSSHSSLKSTTTNFSMVFCKPRHMIQTEWIAWNCW